ncbi:GNAT family N-acetyltransferase [Rhizobium nepotum]|uniref:GNAT family N-acetyltransferase n=1 Tax=Rhizobium nepotum TaxID=1035271 RepID=UPI00336A4C2D
MTCITTQRLNLRPWTNTDALEFASMGADPEVMNDQGGPISQAESDRRLDRFKEAFELHGFTRWVIECRSTAHFLGYAGLMAAGNEHPLGPHVEIGWRLVRNAWGCGIATEAATAALADGFSRLQLDEILAYTSKENTRSQAVMKRLGLKRVDGRDFVRKLAGLERHVLVWAARRNEFDISAVHNPHGQEV